MRKPPKGKSLAELKPELAKEWHPNKNGSLSPFDVVINSHKKVWWKCEKDVDHEWETTIAHRNHGNNCPICSGKKIVESNCLSTLNPVLASEWHPTSNGDLTSFDVGLGSNKKVWWKCDKGEDHEWETSIYVRSIGSGCSICSGKKVVKSNCLSTLNPKLAKEWHPFKNHNLTPKMVTLGSRKKVWWNCNKGFDHEWEADIKGRNRGRGCPICSGAKVVLSNCLATKKTAIAKEWHPTKNGLLTPYDVGVGSSKKVWWKCNKGSDHEWNASINGRNKCPICVNQKIIASNCLATLNPKLAKEWHPIKNGDLTPFDIGAGSTKKVWWKCDKGDDHEWNVGAVTRKKNGCPYCSNKKVSTSNSLATLHPKLTREWHPSKNGDLTPKSVTTGSKKKVWWKCDKGDDHEWEANIGSRSRGNGCSICNGKTVVLSNCLATLNPKLAQEWHPTNNETLTPYNVSLGSNKIVWWKCSKGVDHEWKSNTYDRNRDRGCPYCTLTPQSKQELTITFELTKLFKNIDPKGFKTKLDGRLRSIDIFIPKLNLCIEFDGSYWHKDKRDIDKIKSEMLFEEGFKLIRVREEPLDKIYDTDVISKQPYNGKQVTNDILSMIMSKFELDVKLVSKIKEYQTKAGLQNEKGLDKYIDMVLTEKGNK